MNVIELQDLYALCAAAHVRVHIAGDGTLRAGPRSRLTPTIRAALDAHRAALTDPRVVCDPLPPDGLRHPVVPVREGGARVLLLPGGGAGAGREGAE